MLRVTILGDVWDEIRRRCEQSAPIEDGGFVLARPVETTSGVRLVVDREVSLPSTGSRWNIQDEQRLRPTTEYKSVAMGESIQTDRVPFFVHSHPDGPSRFSITDEEMHEAWLRDFVESSPKGAFGSLVIHEDTVIGSLWTGTDYVNDRHTVDVVNCCGTRPIRLIHHLDCGRSRTNGNSLISNPDTEPVNETTTKDTSPNSDPDWQDLADRQLRLIERLGQERLKSARIAIVGLGGTGSAAAVQSARSGIGSLLLIDPDNAEISNGNRLYGLTLEQAEKGEPKASVLKEHLEKTTVSDIHVIQDDVTSGDYDDSLLDCDLVLGCTDRHTPRAHLNELAVLYGVPYIDVGTRPTVSEGIVLDLFAAVRQVVNGGPCLWCLDVLDSREIRRENLPDDLIEQEIEDGYLRRGGPEPSNILMTTMAATMGLTQSIALLLNQENLWDKKVIFNLWSSELHQESTDRDPDCICQQNRWTPITDDLSKLVS